MLYYFHLKFNLCNPILEINFELHVNKSEQVKLNLRHFHGREIRYPAITYFFSISNLGNPLWRLIRRNSAQHSISLKLDINQEKRKRRFVFIFESIALFTHKTSCQNDRGTTSICRINNLANPTETVDKQQYSSLLQLMNIT